MNEISQLDLINAYHMARQYLRQERQCSRVPYWFALVLRTMVSVEKKGATFFMNEIIRHNKLRTWFKSKKVYQLRDSKNSFVYDSSTYPSLCYRIMNALDEALSKDGQVLSDEEIKSSLEIKETIWKMKKIGK